MLITFLQFLTGLSFASGYLAVFNRRPCRTPSGIHVLKSKTYRTRECIFGTGEAKWGVILEVCV